MEAQRAGLLHSIGVPNGSSGVHGFAKPSQQDRIQLACCHFFAGSKGGIRHAVDQAGFFGGFDIRNRPAVSRIICTDIGEARSGHGCIQRKLEDQHSHLGKLGPGHILINTEGIAGHSFKNAGCQHSVNLGLQGRIRILQVLEALCRKSCRKGCSYRLCKRSACIQR
ncbi:hypothetical protein D3C75_883670 [compost metagenome]